MASGLADERIESLERFRHDLIGELLASR